MATQAQHNDATEDTNGFVGLERGQIMSLKNANGTQLHVASGCLWITQEQDRRDFVLQAGESIRFESQGKAVISALRDSRLTLIAPISSKAPPLAQRIPATCDGRLLSLYHHQVTRGRLSLDRWPRSLTRRTTNTYSSPRGVEV